MDLLVSLDKLSMLVQELLVIEVCLTQAAEYHATYQQQQQQQHRAHAGLRSTSQHSRCHRL